MATQASYFIKVTAVTASITVKLRSTSTGTNWGATLTGDETDMASTYEFDHGNQTISTTGWVEFSMTAANVNTNGVNYIRLQDTAEGTKSGPVTLTFASTNNATSGDRPYLKLKDVSTATLNLRTLMGVGI